MFTNGTQVPCEVTSLTNPTTRKEWPHHRGLRPLFFSNSGVGSFTSNSSTFFSVILRTWVLVRPRLEPATSRSADRCTLWANQAAVANYCALTWWVGLYALTTLETIPLGSLSLVGSAMLGRFWVKGQMNCNAWLSRLRTRTLVNVPSP